METVLTVVLWTFGGAFIIGIIWAIGVASDMQSRPSHHDSKPGSFYYESNKKKGDN
jgi:hypothetical protein